MSDDDDFKFLPAVAEKVLTGAPGLLRMLFPKLASKAETYGTVARYLLEQAMRDPSALSDADIALLDEFLVEPAANWVKYRIVDAQVAALSGHLASSPLFLLPGSDDERVTDPSFNDTIKSGVRATSLDDEAMLNLYAAIKAGEIIRPGSFSKLTVQKVSALSREIIDLFEEAAKHVIAEPSPFLPLGLPSVVVANHTISFGEVRAMAEYGLFASDQVAIEITPAAPLALAFGQDVTEYSCKKGSIRLLIYPVTLVGRELLRIHQCGEAETLAEVITHQIENRRSDVSVRKGRLDVESGEVVFSGD